MSPRDALTAEEQRSSRGTTAAAVTEAAVTEASAAETDGKQKGECKLSFFYILFRTVKALQLQCKKLQVRRLQFFFIAFCWQPQY
jgi:hypothetical protein